MNLHEMCHSGTLLLGGLLLLSFQRGWQTLAEEDCMELKIYSTKVASCCQLEAFLTQPTYGNCLQTMAEKYPDAVWQGTVCAFDCTYREMGILTGVDDINEEQISTNQAVYDQAYQEAIAKAITACMAQKDTIRAEADVVQSECSMFAVKFHACVSLETMRNCPAERWDSSVLCEKVRSGVTVCPL